MVKKNRLKTLVKSFFFVLIAVVSGYVGSTFSKPKNNNAPPISYPIYSVSNHNFTTEFETASAIATPAVVFIKTETTEEYESPMGWFWDFDPFGRKGKSQSTGSGVIITANGYIVTNNHVIASADKIMVVLNNEEEEFEAKVIGTDPSTDLAVLKIEANNLPAIKIANSDNVNVGQWVLAVGNPFNLTSTVTAGIVSAKGRNINIVQNQFPIESFIQTDAAINPGNSGGALVNIKGELVGVNTAIQSKTGSYAGYGFAIPSNIVSKITTDFVKFGELKKAYLGFEYRDLTIAERKEKKLDGILVTEVNNATFAEKAGLKEGDIIQMVDQKPINKRNQMDELVAYKRPQEKIKLQITRNNQPKEMEIEILSKKEYLAIVDKGLVVSKLLGAAFQPLTASELTKFNISNGVKVRQIIQGLTMYRLGITENFIITHINKIAYSDPTELISTLESISGSINLQGINSNGQRSNLNFYGY